MKKHLDSELLQGPELNICEGCKTPQDRPSRVHCTTRHSTPTALDSYDTQAHLSFEPKCHTKLWIKQAPCGRVPNDTQEQDKPLCCIGSQ